MDDLGEPSSYLALADGTPVFSSDGQPLGSVEHVIADFEDDIFDGLVLDTSRLPGGHRFVDAPQVERIYDRGVVLTIARSEAESLPEPAKSAAALETGPGDMVPDGMADKLRKAWHHMKGQS